MAVYRWMFWTDWGTEPKIERAGMDGSHRQTIVSYEVKWPNGLTLDLVKKRVYWVDAKLNVISSCNYDGTERRVILYSPDALQHPFSVTTFEDWVYWTDWDKQAVYRANKFTGKDIAPITATHMVCPLYFHLYALAVEYCRYFWLHRDLYQPRENVHCGNASSVYYDVILTVCLL
jgi:Low-density lipoprotein receptor repeat class B.